MAPSANSDIVVPMAKVGAEIPSEVAPHVHGAEDKTPLQAISHGDLVAPGMLKHFN